MLNLSIELSSLHRLTQSDAHCAFTDLLEWDNELFLCSYRVGDEHVSKIGKIALLLITTEAKVEFKTILEVEGYDLRDPKLSLMPNGQLCVTAFAKSYTKAMPSQMCSWMGDLSSLPQKPSFFGSHYWWLWNPTWLKGNAYGFAYRKIENRVDFWRTDLKNNVDIITPHALSLRDHDLAYPNESVLWFDEKEQAIAVVRRDADTGSAQLGRACKPYNNWKWADLQTYIGGPSVIQLNDSFSNYQDYVLVAGRAEIEEDLYQTAIWLLCLKSEKLSHVYTLPSGGDNSYPGLVLKGKQLYISYYSSHENDKADIYFAKCYLSENNSLNTINE